MRPRVQRASGIPCALWIHKGGKFKQDSGAVRRENAKLYQPSLRGALANEAIHLSVMPRHGLLRCARNDVDGPRRTRSPAFAEGPGSERMTEVLRPAERLHHALFRQRRIGVG